MPGYDPTIQSPSGMILVTDVVSRLDDVLRQTQSKIINVKPDPDRERHVVYNRPRTARQYTNCQSHWRPYRCDLYVVDLCMM